MFMKKISLILLMILLAGGSFAQSTAFKKKPSLGLNFFLKDFATAAAISNSSLSSVLANKQWTKVGSMTPGLTVTYQNGLSDQVDFMANLGGSFVKYPFAPNTVDPSNVDGFLVEADASVNVKLLNDKYFLVPFATAGVGASMYRGNNFAAYAPVGLGLQFKLGQGNFVNLMWRKYLRVTDLTSESFNYSLGFVSPIGDDEAPKPLVTPPPPPPPAPVVEKDTDGDGIVDSKDKCVTVKGIAKYDGCPIPDSDGDGINDENDKCPKVKGTAKYNGCPIPDTDGDGINDEEDKCPKVAGVARYQGCPIPDSDGDGINDEEDKCPNTAGSASNNGCPDLKAQYNFEAKNIQFTTGSTSFTKAATTELDKLVTILKENAEIKKIAIEGHTDNTGKAENNQKLSERRAAAVQAYLVKKGIAAERLSNAGFGDTKPVGSNDTKEGKAANRRVEIKVGE